MLCRFVRYAADANPALRDRPAYRDFMEAALDAYDALLHGTLTPEAVDSLYQQAKTLIGTP